MSHTPMAGIFHVLHDHCHPRSLDSRRHVGHGRRARRDPLVHLPASARSHDLRRQQFRPYVVPAIDVEQGHMPLLTLENVGATAATDIRLQSDRGHLNLRVMTWRSLCGRV